MTILSKLFFTVVMATCAPMDWSDSPWPTSQTTCEAEQETVIGYACERWGHEFGWKIETLVMYFVDRDGYLVGRYVLPGTPTKIVLKHADVIRVAQIFSGQAARVHIFHNHPSGAWYFSSQDWASLAMFQTYFGLSGIDVADFVLVLETGLIVKAEVNQ